MLVVVVLGWASPIGAIHGWKLPAGQESGAKTVGTKDDLVLVAVSLRWVPGRPTQGKGRVAPDVEKHKDTYMMDGRSHQRSVPPKHQDVGRPEPGRAGVRSLPSEDDLQESSQSFVAGWLAVWEAGRYEGRQVRRQAGRAGQGRQAGRQGRKAGRKAGTAGRQAGQAQPEAEIRLAKRWIRKSTDITWCSFMRAHPLSDLSSAIVLALGG